MTKNYYETLGVDRGASEKDIRSAYRRLARKHHPDVNQGQKDAEAKFKEINEAYQVLSDPDSRKKYDRFGDGWRNADYVRQGESAGPSPFTWFNRAGRARTHQTEFSFGGFDSIFSDLRGAARGGVTEEAPSSATPWFPSRSRWRRHTRARCVRFSCRQGGRTATPGSG